MVRIHDTKTGALVDLDASQGDTVGIYACGPTVYNRIHIGNARPFVVFSLLRRFLAHEGYAPRLVVNVTDVNDKIYEAAADGSSEELAAAMTAAYFADTDLLGLGRPDAEPLASETIGPIVALIEDLVARDAAYEAGGDVYFRVRADGEYGSLSHRDVDAMDQGEGDPDPARPDLKDDPLDFALWKATKEGEDTSWDSPWGPGRPGWHIECSAMAEQELGVGFWIHGGGSDLVFPHHENEAAQTRCARGSELARIWMHNGMLQLGGEKMAKSVGNIERLADAVERWGRDTLVFFFSTAHYRQPIQYTDEALTAARERVRKMRDLGRRLSDEDPRDPAMRQLVDQFFDALRNDFNTPSALAHLASWMNRATDAPALAHERGASEPPGGRRQLRAMLEVLGLENLLDAGREPAADDLELLDRRQAARAAKAFDEADRLRDELAARGWEVRDAASGAELVPRER